MINQTIKTAPVQSRATARRFNVIFTYENIFYETTFYNRIYICRVPYFSRLFSQSRFRRFELCRDDRGLFDFNFFGSYLDIIFGKGEKGKVELKSSGDSE